MTKVTIILSSLGVTEKHQYVKNIDLFLEFLEFIQNMDSLPGNEVVEIQLFLVPNWNIFATHAC